MPRRPPAAGVGARALQLPLDAATTTTPSVASTARHPAAVPTTPTGGEEKAESAATRAFAAIRAWEASVQAAPGDDPAAAADSAYRGHVAAVANGSRLVAGPQGWAARLDRPAGDLGRADGHDKRDAAVE